MNMIKRMKIFAGIFVICTLFMTCEEETLVIPSDPRLPEIPSIEDILPGDQTMIIGTTTNFSFDVTIPNGFDSATTDAVNERKGRARIISMPAIGETSGQVVVEFTAGLKLGQGMFKLTVNDKSSQSISKTQNIRIVSPDYRMVANTLNFSSGLSGGSDYYHVALLAGTHYAFHLEVPASADFDLYLYNAEGDEIRSNASPVEGVNEDLRYRPSENGDYTVEIRRASGSGSYSLVVSETLEIPPSIPSIEDILLGDQSMTIGTTTNFSFNVTIPNGFGLDSLVVTAVKGRVKIISKPAIGETNGQVVVEFTAGLKLGQGMFTLTVNDELSQSISKTQNIMIVSPDYITVTNEVNFIGNLSEGADYYHVALLAGTLYVLHLEVPESANFDLYLYNAEGDVIRLSVSPAGVNEDLTYRPLENGDYTVQIVRDVEVSSPAAASYSLAVSEILEIPPSIEDILLGDQSMIIGTTRNFSFNVTIPNGFGHNTMRVTAVMGGTARIISNLTTGETSGQVVVEFTAGLKSGQGMFTLIVSDFLSQTTSKTQNISLVPADYITVINEVNFRDSLSGGSDYYYVALLAETPYAFHLEVPASVNFDLYLHNAEDDVIRSSISPVEGVNEDFRYHSSENGDYLVEIRWASGSGFYSLAVSNISIDTEIADSIHFYDDIVIEIEGQVDLDDDGYLYIRSVGESAIHVQFPRAALRIGNEHVSTEFDGANTTITIDYRGYFSLPVIEGTLRTVNFLYETREIGVASLPWSSTRISKMFLITNSVFQIVSHNFLKGYIGTLGTSKVKQFEGPRTLSPSFNSSQVDTLRRQFEGFFGYEQTDLGTTFIGLGSVSADGSSAKIGLLDLAIDVESPVYPFLSYDFYAFDKRRIEWYYKEEARTLTHGEHMALYMLNIASRVQIHNIGSLTAQLGLTREDFLTAQQRMTLISNDFDILSSSGSSVNSFSGELQKSFLDRDKIIVTSLGNLTEIDNLREGNHRGEFLFLPYNYSIDNGAFITVQAAFNMTNSSFQEHFRSQAGDCRYYTLTVPENGGSGATSQATAQLAAILALMIDINIEEALGYTKRELVEILIDTADDRGAPGVDNIFGHGLVDVDDAVTFMRTKAKPAYQLYSEAVFERD